jgi:phage shock protein PspC (stress-responsive transcriptional regulator)
VNRPLTRSRDNKMIFGVCGGLAERFGLDPVWVRLGFVALALFAGKGILLYFILAIVVPKAPALGSAPAPAQLGSSGGSSSGRWSRTSGLPAPAFGSSVARR